MAETDAEEDMLLTLTADIVAAYVSNNNVSVSELPNLIGNVHQALTALSPNSSVAESKPEPRVSIRSSIKPDSITCLECGKKQKMLKRHLMTSHGMTPADYRLKWGLSGAYPMVASKYADQRRTLAKSIGLGKKGRGASGDVKSEGSEGE